MVKFILTNKSQVWGFDLIVAMTLFLIGIISIYLYAINLSETSESLDSMLYEGNLLSSLLLSDGSPNGWNSTSVKIPGILNEKKINQTKLNQLYAISQDYENFKKISGTKMEVYFNFSSMEISGIGNINGIGKSPGIYENLIKIERFTVYKNKPVKFTLFIWK